MLKLRASIIVATTFYAAIANPHSEIKTCFDGYTLTPKGLCMQDVDELPKPSCPTGEIDGRGCRVQVPKMKKCPQGYGLDSRGDCSYPIITEHRYYCPAGYVDNGDDCVKSVPGETRDFCVNSDRVADRCIRLEKAEPIVSIVCPDGSELDEGKCWRTIEQFDCSADVGCEKDKKEKEKEKEKPCKEPSCKGGHHLRNLNGEELVPVAAPKPFKTVVVAKTCEKRLEVPAIIQQRCPDGMLDDGSLCFVEHVLPLQSECIATGGPVNDCPEVVYYAPKVTRCADGSASEKGKCKELVIGEGVEYCPNGFSDNGVACEGYLEAPLECPSDLTYRNGRCTGKRVHQPVVVAMEEPYEEKVKEREPVVAAKELRVFHHTKTKGKQ